jgi:hypothetical protein
MKIRELFWFQHWEFQVKKGKLGTNIVRPQKDIMARPRPHTRLIFFVVFAVMAGCTPHEDQQREIREKVRAGEHDEAVRLAHKYFADDKRVLLVTLEFIEDQKDKAVKQAYKKNVVIGDVSLQTEPSGINKVVGRVMNQGHSTITGFGIKASCKKDGRVVHEVRNRYLIDIAPGMSHGFQCATDGFANCDDVSVEIIDLGLK